MRILRFAALTLFIAGCQSPNPAPEIPTNIFPNVAENSKPMLFAIPAQPAPPAQPLIVAGPPPVKFITAVNLAITWNPSPDADAAGYNIYWGIKPNGLLHKIDAGTNLSCVLSNLTVGKSIYGFGVAYDSDGTEGIYSPEFDYAIPAWIQMTFVFPTAVSNPVVQTSTDLGTWKVATVKPVSAANKSLTVRAPILSDPQFFRAVAP